MGFFNVLAALLAAGFLAAAFVRQQVVGTAAYQKAMMLFFTAVILCDVATAIPVAGAYFGVVAVPVGYGLVLWSFRELCLALAARVDSGQRGRGDEAW
jgi:hypothetical protein